MWVKSTEVNLRQISDTSEKLTQLGLKSSAAKWVRAQSPLVALYGATAGVVGWLNIPATTNQAVLAVQPQDGTHARWLYWILKNSTRDILASVQGSGQPNLSKGTLDGTMLLWPNDSAEQRRIAEILDTADDAIQKTEALIAKLKQMKAGLLQDLLTRGIDENGNVRSEKTHKFKDSLYGRIPVFWEVVPATMLCDAVIDCKNRTPPESKVGYHVVKTTNVRNGRLIVETMTLTDPVAYEIWTARGKPVAGDVLITREAPVGEVGLVTEQMPPLCLGQRMTMYKINRNRINAQFLLYMLLSRPVQDGLAAKAGGSTVGHVRVGDIKYLPIPVCSLSEQVRIAQRISSLIDRINDENEVLTKYRKLKAGLMHDSLTGTRRVKQQPTTPAIE